MARLRPGANDQLPSDVLPPKSEPVGILGETEHEVGVRGVPATPGHPVDGLRSGGGQRADATLRAAEQPARMCRRWDRDGVVDDVARSTGPQSDHGLLLPAGEPSAFGDGNREPHRPPVRSGDQLDVRVGHSCGSAMGRREITTKRIQATMLP